MPQNNCATSDCRDRSGADVKAAERADDIHQHSEKQAARQLSRRFFLPLNVAATVAELATIGSRA